MIVKEWECQPEAEKFLYSLLNEYKEKNPFISGLEKELEEKTSTRLFDWIDHFVLNSSLHEEEKLQNLGFEQENVSASYRVFTHFGAKLPSILLREESTKHPLGIAVKVESIADFLNVRGIERCAEGSFFSPYRRCLVSNEKGAALSVVERRSSRSMDPIYSFPEYLDHYLTAQERWQTRPRVGDEEFCLQAAIQLAEEMTELLDKDTAAWIILDVERKYWQSRNLAAQIQKNRQDSVGMGWANHDHHTFRSSRRFFALLVKLFEIVGFHKRERFYAGMEAGWGAQIMENTNCGLVLFLDVDLAPDELEIDFSHHPLAERKTLGTVGLWCALHGDSILQGGMHHLEAQFSFEKLKEDLSGFNIKMMNPFSNFPYLRQAFTAGEIWPVDPKRIELLVSKGQITHEEADKFLKNGAIGSHLENLQRNEGYKGFNKDNVSYIIGKTDPRKISNVPSA